MKLDHYDHLLQSADWLAERNLPVGITLTEILEPASGAGAIIFPPSYAFREEEATQAKRENWLPYNISVFRKDSDSRERGTQIEGNVCDLDTVGSQGNRMEDLFAGPLKSLVPQIVIKAKDDEVNLVRAGHRLADGIVRVSDLAPQANEAFSALAQETNALPLAKLAPTSLVFGFWNSREKAKPKLAIKYPRILTSVIRATNVAPIRRSAQFNEAIAPCDLGLPEDLLNDDLAEIGLDSVPAPMTHGGVRVYGEITRKTEFNLIALRALAVTGNGSVDEKETLKLRRYILGLCLAAAGGQSSYNLRQGCLLVAKADSALSASIVFPNGKREILAWDYTAIHQFAELTAQDFGVGKGDLYAFQPAKVKEAREAKSADDAAKKAAKEAKAAKKAEVEAVKNAAKEEKAAKKAEKAAKENATP